MLARHPIALFALALCASANCFAAVGTGIASCEVLAPITVSKRADLSFGKFAAGAGGTITISTSGVRISSGVLPSADSNGVTAAKFVVTGSHGATYSIRHGGSALLTRASSSDTMALTTFSDLSAENAIAGVAASGTLSAGTQSIYIGGTLSVTPSQAVGNYAGEISVTVEYN